MVRTLFIGFVLFVSFSLQAETQQQAYLASLIKHANEKQLATHQEWLNMVHYKPNIFSGYTSQIVTREFFNAADGHTNPQTELEATLASFFSDIQETDEQQNPQCRFIYRYHWLDEHLKFDNSIMPRRTCPRFKEWYDKIDPHQVTLIFPAGTDNSPSSMFGHTLFRIDREDQTEKTRLFSYSINFAAETDETNGLVFAVKGIFGGYPGRFSIMPYYEKVKQYNDMEHRDIWEYQLNLTPVEIERLLQHAWELGNTDFAYYFFLENCSYQLLALLDVARPGYQLADRFSVWAIPGDTVTVILDDEKILKKALFRPSARTKLRHAKSYLQGDEEELVLDLVYGRIKPNDPEVKQLPVERQAMVLITAYDYLQYLFNRGEATRENSAGRSLNLLRARNKLPVTNTIPPVPAPKVRFDQGHGTARVALGGGQIKQQGLSRNFTEIKYRPSYHSLLDNADGYTHGAQINFFDFTFRHDAERDKLRLDEFTLIDIFSLAPRDDYFKPISWKVNTGFVRRPIDDNYEDRMVYAVNGGFGLTYGLTQDLSLFTLLDVSLLFHGDIEDNYAAAAGPDVGLYWNVMNGWNLWLSGSVQHYQGNLDYAYVDYRLENNFALAKDLALRISALESGVRDDTEQELSASLHWYF